ncbi:MAG: sulfurtransferase TusA family protein [Clostridia bacterium]|nr:sulfurtransferase TusA family protein [Clostridia bacterium]
MRWRNLKASWRMVRDFLAGWWRYWRRLGQDEVWIRNFARSKGLQVNPHWMMRTNLKIWIEENRDLYGSQQCPCFEPSGDPALDRKLMCPCKFALADIEATGTCHCTLFGRADLGPADFARAEARLQEEYRPRLKLEGNRLDTRGWPLNPRRGLPVPDPMHQVKQALQQTSGDLVVLVDRQGSVRNLERLAEARGYGFESRESGEGLWEVTLRR